MFEKSQTSFSGLEPDSVAELTHKISRKAGKPYVSQSSGSPLGNVATPVKGPSDQRTISFEQYYAGYNKILNNDHGHSNAGVQPENDSYNYYLPNYNPYAPKFLGSDAKHLKPQPYTPSSSSSSGYLQQQWSSLRNSTTTATGILPLKPKSFNSSKTNHGFSARNMPPPMNSFGSNGFHPVAKFPSHTSQNQGILHHGQPNYQTNGRVFLNGNFKSNPRDNFNKKGAADASSYELNRGPRAKAKGLSSNPSKPLGKNESVQRSLYNKEDFCTHYDHAKFFVIKSFTEDNVHRCVKYDVWSSTPVGNKKLDFAFREAEGKTGETGAKCPVFLFFSVNGSGQFLGVAEMIGPVDFNKKLDFWQLDKWSGFFPVKWHIVKDVPHHQLKHIILKNNDNRDVTYTRDTQEVGLKEGLEMLNIFKSYQEKSSLLDDFDFYEEQEMSLKAKQSVASPAPEYDESEAVSSLVGPTRNLSLGSPPPETV